MSYKVDLSKFKEVKLNLKKIECTFDKKLVEMKECYLKNDSFAFGLHFRIEFIKQIETLAVNGGVSYKYSDTHRPFMKYHYNLCKKPKIRSKFETAIFNVIYNGFHAKIGTLCPIKVGHVYFAKSDGNKDFDPAQIPQIVPTGDFS